MKTIQAILVTICFTGAAVGQQVATQYDRGANFANYHTYKWVTIEGAKQPDQITSQNIRSVVDAELSQKGLTLAESNPDLLIGFQTAMSQQQQVNYYNSGGYWMGGGFGQATTSTIHVGELILDMYAPASHTLVWRGSATKSLNPSSNPDKNYKNLQKAVAKLLKNFPPKP
jgi:hypothetical protein